MPWRLDTPPLLTLLLHLTPRDLGRSNLALDSRCQLPLTRRKQEGLDPGSHLGILTTCTFLVKFLKVLGERSCRMKGFGTCMQAIFIWHFLWPAPEQFPTLPFGLGHRFLPVQFNTILQLLWSIRSLLLDPTWHVSPQGQPGSGFGGNEKWWVSVEDNQSSPYKSTSLGKIVMGSQSCSFLSSGKGRLASVLNQVRRNYFLGKEHSKGPY